MLYKFLLLLCGLLPFAMGQRRNSDDSQVGGDVTAKCDQDFALKFRGDNNTITVRNLQVNAAGQLIINGMLNIGALGITQDFSTLGVLSANSDVSATCLGDAAITDISAPDWKAMAAAVPLLQQVTNETCPILVLRIGAIHVDLLGLVVNAAPIAIDVIAVPGPGNLLGNLLCAITHLLDPATNTLQSSELASLLITLVNILNMGGSTGTMSGLLTGLIGGLIGAA